jgi:predicted nucleic acid-binding protein
MRNFWVCIDASLVVRTLVYGPYSAQATARLRHWSRQDIALIAPSLLAFEVVSTLRRLVYLKEITPEEGAEAFQRFLMFPVRLSHRKSIFPLAWRLAGQFNRSRAYDTTYLALAQLNQCAFWTADEKLYNAVHHKLPWVKWIGDYTAGSNGESNG